MQGVNLRLLDSSHVTISLDETTSIEDVDHLLAVLNGGKPAGFSAESLAESVRPPSSSCARVFQLFPEHLPLVCVSGLRFHSSDCTED